MSQPRLIDGLSEIASDYDAVICDIWGVVHDGHAPFPAAAEALRRFRRERGRVVLLSNAPRMPDSVVEQFRRIGVANDFYDAIVTSGGATREDLIRRGPLSLYFIGPDWDRTLLDGLSIKSTSVADADLAVCIGLKDDLAETPDDYGQVLAEMRAHHLLMLCANPDLKVYRGKQMCWCAGALAKAYEEMGGKVTYFGKPYPAIYQEALKAAGEPQKPLAIGDALVTDLKGAKGAGIEALFIADGLHGEEIEAYTARHLGEMFAVHHVSAKAAMRALKW
ncbi:MAG TPA: TIGR01459 family HAD-type hydrolase [Rhizomicrobium sp.]|nr:TIGR01459 family HAD-type hydrolase [Rhizomicrobium sp.]